MRRSRWSARRLLNLRAVAVLAAAGCTALALVVAGGPAASAQAHSGRVGGSVVLDGSPGQPVASPDTGTVYVPIQCTTSFCNPNTQGHVVDVINAARCNAKVTAGCQVVARARVGTGPPPPAADRGTGRAQVVNGTSKT